MKKIFLLFSLLLVACDVVAPKDASYGQIGFTKIDDLNYDVTIDGYAGATKAQLMGAIDKKMKNLCGMPYLIRHDREEVTSLTADNKPNSYKILLGGQCFTKQDMEDYEKSVAAAKKKKSKS